MHTTSGLSQPFLKPFDPIQCVRSSTYVPRPSTLAMNLGLGTKAKLAITSSLGKLNQKLRMTSLTSSRAYSGVIQCQSAWSASEQRVWVVVLMMGVALLYGNRLSLPLALSGLAQEGNWNTNFKVSTRGYLHCR